jgi:hypothetical protein
MLRVILEDVPTPPELEQFLARNLTTPPQNGSIAEFSSKLSFFERPGRRSDVSGLAGAAVAVQLKQADDGLKRLTEKGHAADQTTSTVVFPQEQRRPRLVLLLVGVLLVGAVLVPTWWWRTRTRPAQPAQANTAQASARGGSRAAPPAESLKPDAPAAAKSPEMETHAAHREALRLPRAQTKPQRSRVGGPSSPVPPDDLGKLPRVAALAPPGSTAAPVEIPRSEFGGTEPVVTLPPATRDASALSSSPRLFEEESTALERVLASYQQAYNRLDVDAALAVWPSADSRALAKAFARLQQQDLKFENCMFAVAENDGTAQCGGVLRYVPRIGKPTPQMEHHVWTIEFARAGASWRIVRVTAQ